MQYKKSTLILLSASLLLSAFNVVCAAVPDYEDIKFNVRTGIDDFKDNVDDVKDKVDDFKDEVGDFKEGIHINIPNPLEPDMRKKEAKHKHQVEKQEAKELRVKGHEEMKPLMEQIKTKHDKIKAIKQQSLTESEKEQIQALKNEIRELDKQVRDLRMKNMKEFESILTEKQQKELKKMKEEGTKNFEKRYKGGQFNPPMPAPEGNPPAENKGGPSENPEK